MKFVINLDSAKERMANFNASYKRWPATHWKELRPNHEVFTKMVSMHNINPIQHKAKCGCFISHYRLLQYIVTNKLSNVLICEDDAIEHATLDNYPPYSLPSFVYLGGFIMNRRMTDGPVYDVNKHIGLNELDTDKYRMMTTLSYWIKDYTTAQSILDYINSKPRWRAIDKLRSDYNIDHGTVFIFPALYSESSQYDSQIRNTNNNSNTHH
jgi:GR25 family glycosyltransferase involved in LPS biosynthesis